MSAITVDRLRDLLSSPLVDADDVFRDLADRVGIERAADLLEEATGERPAMASLAHQVAGGRETRSTTERTADMATTTEREIYEKSAEQIGRELRGMTQEEQRERMAWVEDAEYLAALSPFGRAQARVYHSLVWAVYTGRDTTEWGAERAEEWDRLSHRAVKAVNGRREEFAEKNTALMFREAKPYGRGLRNAEHWDVCMHEAAHAVVAGALGATVNEVTTLLHSGSVNLHDARLAPAERAKICLAGSEVDALAGNYSEGRYGPDFARARALALEVGATENGVETRLNAWRSDVRDVIVKRAHEIVAVAHALDEHWSLDGDELRAIIAAA